MKTWHIQQDNSFRKPCKILFTLQAPTPQKTGFGYLTESGLYLGDNGGSVRVRPGVLLFTGVSAQFDGNIQYTLGTVFQSYSGPNMLWPNHAIPVPYTRTGYLSHVFTLMYSILMYLVLDLVPIGKARGFSQIREIGTQYFVG